MTLSSKIIGAGLAALCAAGCQSGGAVAPVEPLKSKEVVAQYGHLVTVRYESQRAYEWVQKALYWRGQVDSVYAAAQLT